MADTIGGLIDKMMTVDLKMWNNQELLYEIRRMSFEEFNQKYLMKTESAKELWKKLKKSADLNMQRNQLIDEIDEKIVEMILAVKSGKNLDDGKFIQRKHKTY